MANEEYKQSTPERRLAKEPVWDSSRLGLHRKTEDRLGGSKPGEEGQGPSGSPWKQGRGTGYPFPWKRRRGGVPMVT